MKPTEQAVRQYIYDHSDCFADAEGDYLPITAMTIEKVVETVDWAISQMQPEWVSVEDRLPDDETYATIWRKGYSPEQTVARQVFNMTHACYCFVDNSFNVYQIGEVVTHWTPLLEPPTK